MDSAHQLRFLLYTPTTALGRWVLAVIFICMQAGLTYLFSPCIRRLSQEVGPGILLSPCIHKGSHYLCIHVGPQPFAGVPSRALYSASKTLFSLGLMSVTSRVIQTLADAIEGDQASGLLKGYQC
jgi:hypothetical protein